MQIPRVLADGIARIVQRAPGSVRIADEISFSELPEETDVDRVRTRHGEVSVTVYRPPGGSEGSPVYVNLHGGGFVLRHPEQDDPLCRYLASAGITVVNVDYIPAPQSRFPGPIEQAFDVASWAASADREWDGRRLVIGGQSAGGSLAAGVARMAWERGSDQEGELRVGLQVLMYPPLDLTVSARAKRTEGTESLLVRMGPLFDTVYCPDVALRADRLVSPAGAGDTVSLVGIAPAVVVTAARDILRAEGARYAARLASAGALREHIDVPGVGHGFNILAAPRQTVIDVYDRIVAHLRAVLSGPPRLPSAAD